MSIVVVGGDHLGAIEEKLYSFGVTELIHVTGRKAKHQNNIKIPEQSAFVLVFTDYINHQTAKDVKNSARILNIPTVFSKRCWSSIKGKLETSVFVK